MFAAGDSSSASIVLALVSPWALDCPSGAPFSIHRVTMLLTIPAKTQTASVLMAQPEIDDSSGKGQTHRFYGGSAADRNRRSTPYCAPPAPGGVSRKVSRNQLLSPRPTPHAPRQPVATGERRLTS